MNDLITEGGRGKICRGPVLGFQVFHRTQKKYQTTLEKLLSPFKSQTFQFVYYQYHEILSSIFENRPQPLPKISKEILISGTA